MNKDPFALDIEDLIDPTDDENERAALDTAVSVEAVEMIPSDPLV
jgi:hypothetical protein